MISLYDLLQAGNGQLYGQPVAQIFTGLCLTPQPTERNQLFVATVTPHGDTHRFIERAIQNGATGVLCSRVPDCDTSQVTVVIVRDTQNALMAWAKFILKRYQPDIIAIAGSSGKSTTAHLLRHVLSTRFQIHDNVNVDVENRNILPVSLATLMPEHRYSILRFPVTQPGEMEAMLSVMQPTVGIVANVHHAHLDTYETIDRIAEDYGRLLNSLTHGGIAIINADDEYVRIAKGTSPSKTVSVSIDNFGNDFMAYNVIVGVQGTGFDVLHNGKRYLGCWSPLLGRHNLYPVLFTLAAAVVHCGMRVEDVLQAITTADALPGRMKALVGLNNSLVVDDTHASNTQSMLAALDWLAAIRDSRQNAIAILGEFDAHGEYAQYGPRLVGQKALQSADVLITQGAGATAISRTAHDLGMKQEQIHNAYGAVGVLNTLFGRYGVTSNDVVLVKGGDDDEDMGALIESLVKQDVTRTTSMRRALIRRSVGIGRPTWIEVDAGAIANNTRIVKHAIGEQTTLMAVVKADGYGHGAALAAQTALANGASYLGVANINEALDLRSAGVMAPVLVMSFTPYDCVRLAIQHNLTLSLYDTELAKAYDHAARDAGQRLKVHIKVDSGMGRLGLLPTETMALFRQFRSLPYLEIEGIYTHFSTADSDHEYVAEQLVRFREVVRPLKASGFDIPYVHAANSAAMLSTPESHFSMVRVGIALYGQNPSANVPLPVGYLPAMTWKASVAQVRTLPKGHPIGYGNTYVTSDEERIAVLAVGYADGYRRGAGGDVLLQGIRAPIVGRVSMEKLAVRVDHISEVGIGDEAVLMGRQGEDMITADELAAQFGTINYEVLTSALARVPRR